MSLLLPLVLKIRSEQTREVQLLAAYRDRSAIGLTIRRLESPAVRRSPAVAHDVEDDDKTIACAGDARRDAIIYAANLHVIDAMEQHGLAEGALALPARMD